jgi:hypothetical protein
MRIPGIALIALAGCLGAGAANLPAKLPAAGAAAPVRLKLRRKTGPKTHQATGEVLSISSASLTLLHARGRGKQRMKFVLTPLTKEEGHFVRGERIIVYYLEDNGHLIAKRIRPAPARKHARKTGTTKSKR